MENKKYTLVFGASENPDRTAYQAAHRLKNAGVPMYLVSIKKGELFGQPFLDIKEKPQLENVDTITLYVGARNLDQWKEYLFSLKPRRIIFNPGTEREDIAAEANNIGIETEFACTLVLLGTGQY